jgi:signal transduction histidine kinase
VKLRGKFTLALAMVALVAIAGAAVITRQVIVSSYRKSYESSRTFAEDSAKREVKGLQTRVADAVSSLASTDDPLIGKLLRELVKGEGHLDGDEGRIALRELREGSGPVMHGLSLDVLTVTGPDDTVLASPHMRADIGNPNKEVRKRAAQTGGAAYFVRDKVMTGSAVETVLVAQAAALSRDGGVTVALWAGRRVGGDLLAPLRQPGRVDARIVTPAGDILEPPAEKDWTSLTRDPPIRTPLLGADGAPVAYIEVAVSDGDLAELLRTTTLASVALAAAALIGVVILGMFVARRTAHDLDRLVEGSIAAAKGDLDFRVPVRAADEVGAVASAFNFMMEDLRTSKERLVIAERIAAWQEIARRLAHEIKNPLTPIQMAMDTLKKSWKKQHPSFDEILEESTTTVLQEADRLKHIVAEFSDFARMPKPEFGRVDLDELVRGGLALYKEAAPIETHLSGKIPDVDADKNQLNQVLLNLVENARDAISQRPDPATGKIHVTTKLGDAGDRALLIVEDNGPGVPPELKDKVFAPYFTTKHSKGGTGLGLAIVHRIVSDHGGRIVITDAKGGGARFLIELPLRNGTALLASRI